MPALAPVAGKLVIMVPVASSGDPDEDEIYAYAIGVMRGR